MKLRKIFIPRLLPLDMENFGELFFRGGFLYIKFLKKMFAVSKNNGMFAMLFAKQHRTNSLIVGAFFYANTVSADAGNIQGYQTPFTDCTASKCCDCCLATTEGDSLSCIQLINSFIRNMPNNNEITERVNKSNSIRTLSSAKTASSISEILPKIQKINLDLEGRIDCLTKTKNHLFSALLETMESLPDGKVKDSLYSYIWQIHTIDGCLAECITSDDLYNLDSLIHYTKELLILKNK